MEKLRSISNAVLLLVKLDKMFNLNKQQKIYYILRIASAMCFIGHGAFGIITKPVWCNYFAVFGIGQDMAYHLMPIVGTMDIICGLMILFYPIKAFPFWLIIWGLITASLRPLSGEPFAEMIERAGNYGAPMALLILSSGGLNFKNLLKKIKPLDSIDATTQKQVLLCLQIVVCLLLVGHGWLNLLNKKGLLAQYESLGFHNPSTTAMVIGICELLAAGVVFVKPFRPLLIAFFIWKMTSELFYPHYELFEWIERGGSYGCLLALIFALDAVPSFQANKNYQVAID